MKNKYLTIDIDGEDGNVAIIDLGIFERDNKNHLINIENPLVKALEEHFDCEVRIKTGGVILHQNPLMIQFNVVICSDGGDYDEVVTLNETWLY